MVFSKTTKCIYEHEYSFRKKHSTNHALINITDEIRDALDRNDIAIGVFVDFQKAFDTVNQSILISKLDHYGIWGCIKDWTFQFLNMLF